VSALTVDALAVALGRGGELVAGVSEEQWTAQTPCDDWDVRALVSHVVGGNRLFAAALRGEQLAPPGQDADLVSAFADSGRELTAAFDAPGAMERIVQVPIGTVPGAVALHLRITETLVHGWDLATATGQPAGFDEAVAGQALEFTRGALGAIPPERRPFAPAQEAPEDASNLEQLAALLGRALIRD
jgi:uncharacterized protein (TIGR03086 family)